MRATVKFIYKYEPVGEVYQDEKQLLENTEKILDDMIFYLLDS